MSISPKAFRSLLILSSLLSFAAPTLAQRLLYHLDLRHASEHYIDVSLKPIGLRPDTMTFQMPVWAPGIYSTVHYGRFLRELKAYDTKGQEIRVNQVSEDVWKIPVASDIGEIRYRVVDSKNDGQAPITGLAKIDGDVVLANGVTLFGYIDNDKGTPLTISYSLPDGWMIATPLSPATENEEVTVQSRLHETIYNADDFEELADAPVMAAPNAKKVAVWHDKNADYYVIAAGDVAFPIDSFAAAAKNIVRAEISFFKNWPFEEYMFLVYADKNLPHGSTLTHQGSSVYTVNTTDWQPLEMKHEIAATFFKTWDGERFHVSALGPVEYSKPVSVKSLWFNEGGSEYYADILLTRYGLMEPSEFYQRIDRLTDAASGVTAKSVEDLSLSQSKYDESSRRSLCTKGALAAMIMDIDIRSQTNNRRSLDDVLAKMNQDAKSGTTYDDGQLVEVISKYSGIDLKEFDSLYIEGKTPFPMDTYLGLAGATRMEETPLLPTPIAMDFALLENGAIINKIISDTNPADLGLQVGDTLLAVSGKKIGAASAIVDLSKSLSKGNRVPVTVLKNKRPVTLMLTSMHRARGKRIALGPMKHANAKQLALRKALLGKRKLLPTSKTG